MPNIADHRLQPVAADRADVVRIHPFQPVAHHAPYRVAVLHVVRDGRERAPQGVEATPLALDPKPTLQLVELLANRVVGIDVADRPVLVSLDVLLNPRVAVLRNEQELGGLGLGLRWPAFDRAVDRDGRNRPERELADLFRLRAHPVDEQAVGVDDRAVEGEVRQVALAHPGVETQQDEREQGALVLPRGRGNDLSALGGGEDRLPVRLLTLPYIALHQLLGLLAERLVFVQRDGDQLGGAVRPPQHPPHLGHRVVEPVDADARGERGAEAVEGAGLLSAANPSDRLERRVGGDRVEEVVEAGAAVVVKLAVTNLLVADALLLGDQEPVDDLAGRDLRAGCRGAAGDTHGLAPRLDVRRHRQVEVVCTLAARVVGPLPEEEETLAAVDALGLAPLPVVVREERESGGGLARLDDPRGAVTIPLSVGHHHTSPLPIVRDELGKRNLFLRGRQGLRFEGDGCRSGCRSGNRAFADFAVKPDAEKLSTRSSIGQSIGLRKRSAATLTRVSTPPTRSVNPDQTAGTPNRRRHGCRTTPISRASVERTEGGRCALLRSGEVVA